MLVDAELRRYVVVIDICSSTQILETLTRMENPHEYNRLMLLIFDDVEEEVKKITGVIYKFLGDGFIFLVDSIIPFDRVVLCCRNVCEATNRRLQWFITKKLDQPDLKRVGITIGIDEGMIYQTKFDQKIGIDYFGMAINRASRLQSSLKDLVHVNKALISYKLYSKIIDKGIRSNAKETTRSFNNVAEDKPLRCYEIDLLAFSEPDSRLLP